MNIDVIVFSGPTILEAEVLRILPQAFCHTPIACGDIFRVIRLNPKAIVIIDGYFGHTGAVWHKEILIAMERRITVYGASSMGALRAAELDTYGMIGFGEIYNQYRSGEIIGDDEVAVTHNVDNDYKKTITALINDRHTLRRAVNDHIIKQEVADEILSSLKNQPYYLRSLFIEIQNIKDQNLSHWIKNNYIDQKKIDAISLLTHLSEVNNYQQNYKDTINSNKTLFTKKIYREVSSSSFKKSYPQLPDPEKCLIEISESDRHYLIHLAKLLHISSNLRGINDATLIPCHEKILDIEEVKKLLKNYLIYTDEYSKLDMQRADLLEYLRLGNTSIKLRASVFIAELMNQLLDYIDAQEIIVSPPYKQIFLNIFRKENGLLSSTDTTSWMTTNDLITQQDLQDFANSMAIFYFIVEKNNLDYLGVKTTVNSISWLARARELVLGV